jgi:hypothetical protein
MYFDDLLVRDIKGTKRIDKEEPGYEPNEIDAVFSTIAQNACKFRLLPSNRNPPANQQQPFSRQPSILPNFFVNTHTRHANYEDTSTWEDQRDRFHEIFPEKLLDETGDDVSISTKLAGQRERFSRSLLQVKVSTKMQEQKFTTVLRTRHQELRANPSARTAVRLLTEECFTWTRDFRE